MAAFEGSASVSEASSTPSPPFLHRTDTADTGKLQDAIPESGIQDGIGGSRHTNPGSKGHWTNACKPCNKYNPARPDDSCKHGDQCDFCHELHERPKHRGQRGRHALQRRQYLESRDTMEEKERDLIDRVYRVPHLVFEDVKRKLDKVPKDLRKDKDHEVLEMIRNIGERAQNCRPDKNRVRGARIVSTDGVVPASELDGRFKWLIGTLHLMVRKMLDAKEEFEKIDREVEEVLNKCRDLPKIVDGTMSTSAGSEFLPALAESGPPYLFGLESPDLQERFRWLEGTVQALYKQEQEYGDGEEDGAVSLKRIRALLKNWHVRIDFDSRLKEELQASENLKELSNRIERGLESGKEDLFEKIQHELQEHQSYEEQYISFSSELPSDWKLEGPWKFLEEKIQTLTIEELKRGTPSYDVRTMMREVFEECAKLPGTVQKIQYTLQANNCPAWCYHPESIAMPMKSELENCKDLQCLQRTLRKLTN